MEGHDSKPKENNEGASEHSKVQLQRDQEETVPAAAA